MTGNQAVAFQAVNMCLISYRTGQLIASNTIVLTTDKFLFEMTKLQVRQLFSDGASKNLIWSKYFGQHFLSQLIGTSFKYLPTYLPIYMAVIHPNYTFVKHFETSSRHNNNVNASRYNFDLGLVDKRQGEVTVYFGPTKNNTWGLVGR